MLHTFLRATAQNVMHHGSQQVPLHLAVYMCAQLSAEEIFEAYHPVSKWESTRVYWTKVRLTARGFRLTTGQT
jgi:hypothetical protein